jgi:hypothetical protein
MKKEIYFMKISDYKIPIILFIATYLIAIIIFLVAPPNSTPYTPLIPIDNAVFEIFTALIIYSVTGILGAFLLGYVLAPIFLFIHVKLIGRKLQYGFIEREPPSKFRKTFKGFFPVLLALNLSLLLASNQDLMNIIIYPEHQAPIGQINPVGVIFLLMYTVGVGMGLFSAVWLIDDTGLICSNKKKIEGTDKTIEIRSVGSTFKNILKGYAGISVILSFTSYVIFTITTFYSIEDLFVNALPLIGLPIALTCFNTLTMVLLDLAKDKNKKYIRYLARKLGIVDELEVNLLKRNEV